MIFLGGILHAQDFEGKVVFDIKYENTSNYELRDGLPVEQVVYLKDSMSRVEQDSPLGTQVVITNYDANSLVILVNVMGQKLALTLDQAELDRGSGTVQPEIKYKWFKRKEIAGYKCKLAIVTYPPKDEDDKAETTKVWYTKELPKKLDDKYPGLKGYPMKFLIPSDGYNQVMTARTVEEKELEQSLFTIPEGYEEMTMEEFQKSLSE